MANQMKVSEVISDIWGVSPSVLAFFLSEGRYKIPKHIQYLESKILESIHLGNRYLCINMPPRHGKSEYLSKYLPLWFLFTFPQRRIILTSYESSFAAEWGQKVKQLIVDNESEIHISISKDNRSSSHFVLEGTLGSMSCMGAGGAITGKGADLLIIDDPVKNDAEANSPHQREILFDWFKSTVFTRIEPGGVMVLLMTRWHEDDLTGRLKQSFSSDPNWEFITIPAIAESDDFLGREAGAALWEERFDHSKLLEIERTIGKYWFSALYMQKPSPAEGALFNKRYFRYFTSSELHYHYEDTIALKEKCKIYATVDLAISTSEMADYSVVLIFAVSADKKIFIEEIIRERFEPTHHYKLIESVYHKYKPVLIGIESVQYQIALVKELSNGGFPVKKLLPQKDKISRALRVIAKLELGEIYFKRDASWLQIFENELLEFPNSKHG
jgi:predicted phage terminase large subunit-like protein